MFRRLNTLLQHGKDLSHVACQQCLTIQPEAGEDAGAQYTVDVGRQDLIGTVHQDVPADFLLVKKDSEVFGHLGGLVQVEFHVQVVGGIGTAYLREQFGNAAEVLAFHP